MWCRKGYRALRKTAKKSRILRGIYHTFYRPQGLKTINKAQIDAAIRAGQLKGMVSPRVGQERVIVSLTSFPARLEEVHYTLYSLLNQDLPLTAIKLWLIEEEYDRPRSVDSLPASLREMQQYGVEICWVRGRIRSYAKLLPTLAAEPEAVIITADDDVYYPPDWASRLYREHLAHPQDIIAHRAHLVSYGTDRQMADYNAWPHCIAGGNCRYANFLTGVGGVLYPPHSLHPDVMKRELYQKLAPKADDIWFWAMAVRNHWKIRIPEDAEKDLVYDSQEMQEGENRLSLDNTERGANDVQMRAVLDAYPEIEEILQQEHAYHVLTQ